MATLDELVEAVTEEFTQQVTAQGNPGQEEAAMIGRTCAAAAQMVMHHIGAATVPKAILTLATLEVTRDLWARRDAPGGIFTTFGGEGAPVRLARDPMRAGYEILAPYVGGGFA